MKLNELKLLEGKGHYQVKIGGSWNDRVIPVASLEDMAKSIEASPYETSQHGDLSWLTEIICDYIGAGPNKYGWDEMDVDVISFNKKDEVLKIRYHFSGFDSRHDDHVRRDGEITIMPGN